MWIRNNVSKHANFESANAARTKWLLAHPTSATDHGQPSPEGSAYKIRVKQHATNYKFIVWTSSEGKQS